jgi:hypothetical protein
LIKIKIPDNNRNEREYIINIIFSEFLGLEYSIEYKDSSSVNNYWEIHLDNENKILTEDHFFKNHPESLTYLKQENITTVVTYVKNKYTPELDIPVIYGDTADILKQQSTIIVPIDIFASSFFMLTRWEEYVNKTRDEYDRFPAKASLAYNCGFLNRPVVNEYVEMLWNMMKELEPRLVRKKRKGQVIVSCDVDEPFDSTVRNLPTLLRVCGGDLIKRKAPLQALKRVRRYCYNKIGNFKYDENYTFEWYMSICEQNNLKAAFYFIPTKSEPQNCTYSITEERIIQLLKNINKRGHEIGVHGSYQTYCDKEKAVRQKAILLNTLEKVGIEQVVIGNRQHYLRWNSATTPDVLDEAGFEYDTSGSFADSAGFRYGVCYEFSMWSILNRKRLKIKQRPLIVMECSVIDDLYMGLGRGEEAYLLIIDYIKKIYKYNGNFILLWHNSRFKTDKDKKLFQKVITYAQ